MRLRLISAMLAVGLFMPLLTVPSHAGPVYPTVNMNCNNTDIVYVLKQLAKAMHMNLVTDNTVKGTVTMDLRGVRADRAFRLVTTVHDLSYKTLYGNTIVVGSQETLSKLP